LALAVAGCDEEKKAVTATATASTPTLPPEYQDLVYGGVSCTDIQQGDQPGDVLIESEFPLQGPSRSWTVQANKAVARVLEQHDWRGGDTSAAFQECDTATAAAGDTDPRKCSENAGETGINLGIVAVIGVPDASCAAVELPWLNKAPGGGVALVGLATGACLTQDFGGCDSSKYSPSGKRSFVRVVPNTLDQAAALAYYAKTEGPYERVVVLDDGSPGGREFAEAFSNAAGELAIDVVGTGEWAYGAEAALDAAGAAKPDVLVLAGEYDEDLLRAKVRRLGSNVELPVLASEDFMPPSREVGPAATGVVVASPFLPWDLLPEGGRAFMRELVAGTGDPIQPGSVYAAQAAELALNAIGKAGGQRAGTRAALFGIKVDDGLLPPFEIDEHGDAIGLPVAFYRLQNGARAVMGLTPPADLVDAAAGG